MTKYKQIIATIVVLLSAIVIMSCDGDIKKKTYTSAPKLTAKSHGYGIGWERSDCFTCHIQSDLTKPTHDNFTAESSCLIGCHGNNGVGGGGGEAMANCTSCHGSSIAMDLTGLSMHTVDDPDATQLSNHACQACHGLPQNHMDGFNPADDLANLNDWMSLGTTNINNFCVTCHSANGATNVHYYEDNGTPMDEITIVASNMTGFHSSDSHGTTNSKSGLVSGTLRPANKINTDVQCVGCHQQHTSSNVTLFPSNGSQVSVVTDSSVKNVSITITDKDNSSMKADLCVVCHQGSGAAAPNGLTQVTSHSSISGACGQCHNPGMTCNGCHGSGFSNKPLSDVTDKMMVDGKYCNDCHQHGGSSIPAPAMSGTADFHHQDAGVRGRF